MQPGLVRRGRPWVSGWDTMIRIVLKEILFMSADVGFYLDAPSIAAGEGVKASGPA